MKKIVFVLMLFSLALAETSAQSNYFLRTDVGLSASADFRIGSGFHFGVYGGIQLHRKIFEESSISIGLSRIQHEQFYLTDMWSYNVTSVLYDFMVIPVLYHRRFGADNRFEWSAGVYYSFDLGGKGGEHDDGWSFTESNRYHLFGISLGLQYTIIKSDRFDLALGYRGLSQLHNTKGQSIQNTSVLFLSGTLPFK